MSELSSDIACSINIKFNPLFNTLHFYTSLIHFIRARRRNSPTGASQIPTMSIRPTSNITHVFNTYNPPALSVIRLRNLHIPIGKKTNILCRLQACISQRLFLMIISNFKVVFHKSRRATGIFIHRLYIQLFDIKKDYTFN